MLQGEFRHDPHPPAPLPRASPHSRPRRGFPARLPCQASSPPQPRRETYGLPATHAVLPRRWRQMSVLFILGRPAAGKTTVAWRLKTRIEARNPLIRIAMIDEYAILQDSLQGRKPPAITWHQNGTFELLDRTYLSKTALELETRAFSHMRTHDLVLCELARAAYNELFGTLGERITASMRLLYIHAPLELCRIRNRRRQWNKSQPSVPDLVLTRYYTHDDSQALLTRYPERSFILDNSADDNGSLARAVDDYLERHGKHLTTIHEAESEVGVL